MVYGKLFSLRIMFLVIFLFTISTNCMKQKTNNKNIIKAQSTQTSFSEFIRPQKKRIDCFNFCFTKNVKNYFRPNEKTISLYIFSKSMTIKSLNLILECFYEPMDIQNFITFLQKIPHHAKISDKLPFLHQKLTKIFFDFRCYTLNKNNIDAQNINEYFYPQNSAFQYIDLKICPISQIFVLKFSKNHTFTIIFYKNGDLRFKSSVPFEKRSKGILNLYCQNWTQNVFSINLLPSGDFAVLNIKLGMKILITCFRSDKPTVGFFATTLDDLKKYFRASPYLGFSQIEFFEHKLSALSFCWDNKKHLISIKQCDCILNDNSSELRQLFTNQTLAKFAYLYKPLLNKKMFSYVNVVNIDSILTQKFLQQPVQIIQTGEKVKNKKSQKFLQQPVKIIQTEENDSDENGSYHEKYKHTKSIKIMVKSK